MRGHGPKLGGFGVFGDVWDVNSLGSAAGSGTASPQRIPALGVMGRCKRPIIPKNPNLYVL